MKKKKPPSKKTPNNKRKTQSQTKTPKQQTPAIITERPNSHLSSKLGVYLHEVKQFSSNACLATESRVLRNTAKRRADVLVTASGQKKKINKNQRILWISWNHRII